MTIDWFTVVAQIINFLILVWLLKRFLYRPILDAIDAREQRIADELKNADAIQNEAQKQRDEFAHKNTEFEEQKQILMQEASKTADTERTRLIAVAREQADALGEKRQQALKREQQNLQSELRILASDEVFAIARKALTDLTDATLEEKIVDNFIGRLQAMDADAKQAFADALSDRRSTNETQQPVLTSSAFELQPLQKAAVQTALNTALVADIPLKFETDSKLICGLRLSVNGQQISWSIEDYLASLEKKLGDLKLGDLLQTVTDKKISASKSEIPEPAAASAAVPQ